MPPTVQTEPTHAGHNGLSPNDEPPSLASQTDHPTTGDDPYTPHRTLAAATLGPATVVAVLPQPGWMEVLLPGGSRAQARMALAVPYQPVVGDELLIIGQGTGQDQEEQPDQQTVYAIGVLKGSGQTILRVPGDFAIDAPQGGITLSCAKPMRVKSRQRIDIASPRLNLRAVRLQLSAQRLVQRVANAYTWVRGLFQIKSRRCRTVADESFLVKTKRARMKSGGDFNINGKTIHLG